MSRRALLSVLAFALSQNLLGCADWLKTKDPEVDVQTGVFFGGQLQRRSKWALILDTTRQTQGFRVLFKHALGEPSLIAWEVTRLQMDSKRRVQQVTTQNQTTLPAGTTQNDQLIPFEQMDRPGSWRLKVRLLNRSVYAGTLEIVPSSAMPQED